MAIDPPSDIVLDVARAADPTRAAAVTQKLERARRQRRRRRRTRFRRGAGCRRAASAASFAAPRASPTCARAWPTLAGRERTRPTRPKAVRGDAAQQFRRRDAAQGRARGVRRGHGGDMWRSMLAEKMSDQIAKSGALGISRRSVRGRPISAARPLTHAAHADGASGHVRRHRDERQRSVAAERGRGRRRRVSVRARQAAMSEVPARERRGAEERALAMILPVIERLRVVVEAENRELSQRGPVDYRQPQPAQEPGTARAEPACGRARQRSHRTRRSAPPSPISRRSSTSTGGCSARNCARRRPSRA